MKTKAKETEAAMRRIKRLEGKIAELQSELEGEMLKMADRTALCWICLHVEILKGTIDQHLYGFNFIPISEEFPYRCPLGELLSRIIDAVPELYLPDLDGTVIVNNEKVFHVLVTDTGPDNKARVLFLHFVALLSEIDFVDSMKRIQSCRVSPFDEEVIRI